MYETKNRRAVATTGTRVGETSSGEGNRIRRSRTGENPRPRRGFSAPPDSVNTETDVIRRNFRRTGHGGGPVVVGDRARLHAERTTGVRGGHGKPPSLYDFFLPVRTERKPLRLRNKRTAFCYAEENSRK